MKEGKHKQILIIDDNPTIGRLFGAKLAEGGFEPLYAHTPHDGRNMARRYQPALILLDIRMPEVDGVQLAERFKTEEETKDIPVVFLTNSDLSPEDIKIAKETLKVADYMHKSIDLDEFLERVKKVVGESK